MTDTNRPFASKAICVTCGFDLWLPITRLNVSTLSFYNDGRFPGRCILVLNDHADHLHELPDDVTAKFALDQKRAGMAILAATGADRINYAVLGNTVAHVHAHLIPRRNDETIAQRPIWEHPGPQFKLTTAVRDQLMQRIKDQLE